ncbi:Zinc finger protein [Actinidia chinensis var. chinensis]|uniref:Zinc finger protein n=1 Tax=Actinidia chinensis var. chinensis TaxID=1590841 RepID=A0A2R6QPH1_ACTCC|nr:Zinc finger protein [Actinidia chinensis var. chinensis]
MEKHKCKPCLKSFANGRALGGQMRCHMMNLCVPPKIEQQQLNYMDQLGRETESASSSSSSDDDDNEERSESLFYELRESPKKSIRLVDREFSFARSEVLIQDTESETESSQNPIRRRSKRIRKSGISDYHPPFYVQNPKQVRDAKKSKSGMFGKTELEPVSSISDTSPEEDVAYCLMMLSRDKWKRNEKRANQQAERDEEDENDRTDDSGEYFKSSKGRGGQAKYVCETCFKVFRSYQALGGHRASHKKPRLQNNLVSKPEPKNGGKVHECPYCFRVFSSGQALGGHKRTHVTGSSSTTIVAPNKSKFGENMIDLNLPAPIEEDEISQIELPAVSHAKFVKPIRQ